MSACLRSTDRLSSFAIVLRIASSSVRSSLGWVSGMLLDSAIYRGLCPKLTTQGTKNTKKIKVKGKPEIRAGAEVRASRRYRQRRELTSTVRRAGSVEKCQDNPVLRDREKTGEKMVQNWRRSLAVLGMTTGGIQQQENRSK